MRRISLALALVGAVAAAGCGGASNKSSNPTGSTGDKGVAEGTFTITVQNGQNNSPGLAMTAGVVTSNPPGINCGSGNSQCSAQFPTDSLVTLTARPNATMLFFGWAADCVGLQNTCVISGQAADQYVLAQFGTEADRTGHPNWTVAANGDFWWLHSTQASADLAAIGVRPAGLIQCAACHGASLEGAGLAVSCANCHAGSSTALTRYDPVALVTLATGETCGGCHADAGNLHQGVYNQYVDSVLVASITNVATSANPDGTYATTVTFTLAKDGVAYDIVGLTQKRYSATRYISYGPGQDPVFETSTAVSFGTAKATTTPGRYTVKADKAAFNLLTSDAFVYFYFGEKLLLPKSGNYNIMDNVASVSRVFGTIGYDSSANVSGCEKCHGVPYMKHGYRAAKVAGLPDMVACKACHHDQRVGTDFDWQVLANEPASLASVTANGTAEANWKVGFGLATAGKYGYVANVMNDTHMSHAMEFAYPQSMANCATCHAGKLDRIFTDANFNGVVCKSCHATTRTGPDVAKRAPSFAGDALGAPLSHHAFNWANGTITSGGVEYACSRCHSDAASNCSGGVWDPADVTSLNDGVGPTCYGYQVPLWRDLHNGGFNRQVYTDATQTVKFADQTGMSVTSATFDAATNVLTVNFSATGAGVSGMLIKPTVVVSLYGYGTKDFIVNGHGSKSPWTPDTDSKRWLEWTEGSSSNSTARLAVSPATATVGNATWTATANLTAFASLLTSGAVTRAEVGILPVVALDPDQAVSSTNPAIQIAGASATVSLTGTGGILTDAFATRTRSITDAAKCNKCHDGLGVEFHSPSYGSAGTLGCRLCHQVGNGGSHLEMQSRSIDSYVHAIHAFQKFDISGIDFADPVQAMEYRHHIESTYPNFTTLSCESCHNAGTYNVPEQTLSMPGILSAASTVTGTSRAIAGVPSVVTGPAARACGSCHRAMLINEDDAAGLASLDSHTKAFGYRELPRETATPGVFESTYQRLLGLLDVLFP